MNILIVNTLYTPYKIGGAERSVQLLAEMLAKKGNQVTVATLHDRKDITTDKINNVTIVRFPLANLYWPYDDSNQKN
jgi:glycosyltransferase involved in cell wall biosynthesis